MALLGLENSQQQTPLEDTGRGAQAICCHVSPSAGHSPTWPPGRVLQAHQTQLSAAVAFPLHGSTLLLEVDLLSAHRSYTASRVAESRERSRAPLPALGPAPGGTFPGKSRAPFPRGGQTRQRAPLLQQRVPTRRGESLRLQQLPCTEQLLRVLAAVLFCRRLWSQPNYFCNLGTRRKQKMAGALMQETVTVHAEDSSCFWDCISGSQVFSFSPAGPSSFNAKALRFN